MPTWEREAYGRSVEWAQYFETIIEQIPTQEEELFLNKKLQEISLCILAIVTVTLTCTKVKPEFKIELSVSNLSCSRHLLLRTFLYSPFIDFNIIQFIMQDYLQVSINDDSGMVSFCLM
jgi:hypothetical protein